MPGATVTSKGQLTLPPQLVVCELVWVLGYAYDKGRSEIAAGLENLLRARQLAFEDVDQVRAALERFATFDARLLRSPEFAEV